MAKKVTLQDKKIIRDIIKNTMIKVFGFYDKGKPETDQQKRFFDLASEYIYEELNKKEEK